MANEGGRHHGGNAASEQDGGSQTVNGIQRHHDGSGEVGIRMYATQFERLGIDVDQNTGARSR